MAWGRLALLQAANEDAISLQKTAALFGFESTEIESAKLHVDNEQVNYFRDEVDPNENIVISPPTQSKRPPALFVRVNKHQSFIDQDHSQPAYMLQPEMRLQAKDDSERSYSFDSPSPILPMSRLLPFLFNGLGQLKVVNRLDHHQLNRQLAQGKPLYRLPRKRQQRWPQRLQIIVDVNDSLEPYWTDFAFIVGHLQKCLGADRVMAFRINTASMGAKQPYITPWPSVGHPRWHTWQLPGDTTAVLVFGNLGVHDGNTTAKLHWEDIIQRLANAGVSILTLSPISASPKDIAVCRLARPNPLNDQYKLPRHPSRQGFSLGDHSAIQIEDCLTLLSPLPLIDCGLIRRLRLSLDWGDSTLEGLIWNHPHMQQTSLGIRLHASMAAVYRDKYQRRFAASNMANKLWEIVNFHHANAFEGLQQIEALSQGVFENKDNQQAIEYFKGLCASRAQAEPHSAYYKALVRQCRTVLASMPKTIWKSHYEKVAYDVFAMAYEEEIRAGQWPEALEPGFDPAKLQWLLDAAEREKLVIWHIMPNGEAGGFSLHCGDKVIGMHEISPLDSITAHANFPPMLYKLGGENTAWAVKDGDSFSLIDGALKLKTIKGELELGLLSKPNWALAMGQEKGRLYLEALSMSGVPRRYDWLFHPSADAQDKGFWHPHHLEAYTAWASLVGMDQYGLYADLTINNITQRFRWIPPGEFVMGSPEDEPMRNDNESQHTVILTEGYWLADTACTQAFWQAIMRDNPAHFNDNPVNPVEQVSWEDVQQFLKQLNAKLPDLNAALPTEAQWEYACRASSHTPFSFGYNITPEQVNYDGNYPYADGQKGVYREKTIPVKSLPANAWGLYEMHGNVWEWCQDWYGDYPSDTAQNPMGPSNGTLRVLRGGSWFYKARDARSALRFSPRPGLRDDHVGFRLALGQTGPVQAAEISERSRDGQASGSAAGQSRGRERVEPEDSVVKRIWNKIKPK